MGTVVAEDREGLLTAGLEEEDDDELGLVGFRGREEE